MRQPVRRRKGGRAGCDADGRVAFASGTHCRVVAILQTWTNATVAAAATTEFVCACLRGCRHLPPRGGRPIKRAIRVTVAGERRTVGVCIAVGSWLLLLPPPRRGCVAVCSKAVLQRRVASASGCSGCVHALPRDARRRARVRLLLLVTCRTGIVPRDVRDQPDTTQLLELSDVCRISQPTEKSRHFFQLFSLSSFLAVDASTQGKTAQTHSILRTGNSNPPSTRKNNNSLPLDQRRRGEIDFARPSQVPSFP